MAIRRDQVGQAIRAYGGALATPMPSSTTDDDLRTNQGTVMMMKTPLAPGQSMHRHAGGPHAGGGHNQHLANQGNQGQGNQGQGNQGQGNQGLANQSQGGGMMSPALMPPRQQAPNASLSQGLSDSGGHAIQPGNPPAGKGAWPFVVGAIVLALASFAIIAIALELLGKR